MAVKQEEEPKDRQGRSGWVEGRDEDNEVVFVKPTLFDPAEHTEQSGRVATMGFKVARFGTHRKQRQRVSL